MNLNIQTKLFLLLAGLTTLVLVVVLLAVNTTATNNITDDVIGNFEQTQSYFQTTQRLKYDRLVESALLIQENSTFKANLELNDAPSMQVVVEQQFAPFIKADLFTVTNTKGEVLAWLDNGSAIGKNMLNRSTVKEALEGKEPPLEITWPDLWAVDGELFQIVSVPVYAGNEIIGSITLGTKFTEIEAKELVSNTQLDVILFLEDQPIASSKDSLSTKEYQGFVQKNTAKIDSVLSALAVSEPFRNALQDKEHFAFISPLGKGEPAFYVANVPVALELQILKKIQNNIFTIGLVTILVIIPLAILLGRILSRPINLLSKAMLRVQDGELNVHVEPKTNDEVGVLAHSFNKMVDGLKERFALQKYVGGHTLNMIKNNKNADAVLGGTRQELAIIFTDLRNSTKIIERSEPEIFIKELNKCLSYQSESAINFKGSVDKYVGDSMIALFEGEDALDRAIKCAVTIQKKYKNGQTSAEPFFDGIGIGINYGSMLLGNMGAAERMDYTVIGPEVNLCARLCSEAKAGQILVPEKAIKSQRVNVRYDLKKTDRKSLKGFSNELEVVEVVYD